MSLSKFTPRHIEILDMYLADIRQYSTLSDAQVRELIDQYRSAQCRKSRDRVIESNLRYGVSLAKQYQTDGVELADLIQEASLGLIAATERYRLDSDTPFILYAAYWMRKYLSEYVARYRTTITPAHHAAQLPSVSSLDVPLDSEDEYTMAEELESEDDYEIAQAIDEEQIGYAIHLALDTLDETESEVLRLSYGIGCHPEFDDTIAKRLNLGTAEHVRQLREIAERKLYFQLNKNK